MSSYEEAIRGADVVAATTHATEPVVRREWLSPGVHVNSVGLNPNGREVDAETVQRRARSSSSRASPHSRRLLQVRRSSSALDPQDVHAELGELVAGTKPGRTSRDEITLYKSVGVAVQDVAAAALVLEAARERSLGRVIELEETA